MKNITLSAEEQLIDRARKKANHNGTTLNVEFRRWLEHYTGAEAAHHRYQELMERLAYAAPGRTFRRDELNER